VERPSQGLLLTLLIAAGIVGCANGLGLVFAALGVGAETGWRRRWGVWLPTVFGIAVIVGGLAFIARLLSGID